jgi:predicted DNA-binding transcriptional regulator AlpA
MEAPTTRQKRGRRPIDQADVADDVTQDRPFTDISLIRLAELVVQLGVSSWTLGRWVKAGIFPPPIYLTPKSPAVWRVRDITAFIEKRRRSRRAKPLLRGALKQRWRLKGDAAE